MPVVRLRLGSNSPDGARLLLRQVENCLPQLKGGDISVSFLPRLIACRGRLVEDDRKRGAAVYAATFIRRREMVFESVLLRQPRNFRFFCLHEVFHFVWPRLGNPARTGFAGLLKDELSSHARGELAESAGVAKHKLNGHPTVDSAGALWRNYICESFCDTAAWIFAGPQPGEPVRLAARWQNRRRAYMLALFSIRRAC